jgi:RNA polymerase sigma factor (sigma-70 family)
MKDRNQFFIPVNGQLVVVTVEVYNEYYKMSRRERYLEERDLAKGKVLYSDMDADEMLGEEAIPDLETTSVEQTVLDAIMVEKLRKCLVLLSEDERALVDVLFFEGYSEREVASLIGISQKGVNKRKSKLLAKLKKLLEK